jgi:hypothetical protein
MRETRLLDRMAIIGAVLAILAIVLPIIYTARMTAAQDPLSKGYRQKALDCMPTPDIRADLDIAGLWNSEIGEKKRLTMLREAVKKYPNSGRLWFRLGLSAKGSGSENALRRAAQLDPQNAMPLYMLASQAAERKSWDEAISLLRRANRLPGVDRYLFPYEACRGDGLLEMTMSDAGGEIAIVLRMRRLVVSLTKRASDLHAARRTKEAVEILGDTRTAARRLMQVDEPTWMDVLVGQSMIALCAKPEKAIAVATGDKATLARLAAQKQEDVRIRAGMKAYLDRSMEELVRRMARFAALGIPVAVAGFVQAIFVIFSLIWWGVLSRRSRGIQASELHLDATVRAFPVRKLLTLFGFIIIFMAAATVALVQATHTVEWDVLGAACGIGMAVPAIAGLAVAVWAAAAYKKAFRAAAQSAGEEISKPWKGYPIADKRERQRRLTGVLGGMMISLVVWLAILSGYMKTTMNALPWQIERGAAGFHQQETRYIADLVAGKIKVPQKYIRQVEQDRARKPKPGG